MSKKIDVSKIAGYSDMTADEKLAALESYEIPDPDYSGYVKKDAFDKAASEAAEWKRKHNALLSEEEQKKLAREEELNALREKVAASERKEQIALYKAQFTAMGYSETLAQQTAEAAVDGDNQTVFANQKAFLEAHDQALKANLMAGTPTPPAGSGGSQVWTASKIMAIKDTGERQRLIQEHLDLFQ